MFTSMKRYIYFFICARENMFQKYFPKCFNAPPTNLYVSSILHRSYLYMNACPETDR